MTTPTGKCMPLVGVLSRPSTARATAILLQQTRSPRRCTFDIPMINHSAPTRTVQRLTFSGCKLQITKRVETASSVWKGWNWRSEGDLLLNGAYFTPSGAGASASYSRASSLGAKSSSMVASITSDSGALSCRKGTSC
jgi:hypothetical protein